MKKFNTFLLLLCLSLVVSCKKKIDLSECTSAKDQVIKEIDSKKIIFIGENHSDINPILFMSKNIAEFYEHGVRYIFLEDNFNKLNNDKSFSTTFICPPWIVSGGKYEEKYLENEIIRINKQNPDDKLNVIFPENDLTFNSEWTATEVLNYRDKNIQQKIKDIMNFSRSQDKAIVFYGSDHGSSIPEQWYNERESWKMTGVYLSDFYSKDYVSFIFDTLSSDKTVQILYPTEKDYLILPKEKSKGIYPEFIFSSFNYLCVSEQTRIGIPYGYVLNDEIIADLIKNVKFGLQHENKNYQKSRQTEVQKNDILLSIYYLKYHFGKYFPFNLEDKSVSLEEALNQLERNLFSTKQKITDFSISENDVDLLGLYINSLFCNRNIENALFAEVLRDEEVENIIEKMNQAVTLNPRDIWPQYWISYFQTEVANNSGNRQDYKTAIDSWNELLKNDLLYASPVLKIAYQKLSSCYEALDDLSNSLLYSEKAIQIDPDFCINPQLFPYYEKK